MDKITSISDVTWELLKFLAYLYGWKVLEYWNSEIPAIGNFTEGTEQFLRTDSPFQYAPAGGNMYALSDWDVHRTTHTLTSGAIANSSLYAPGASKAATIYYIILGTNAVATPDTLFYDVLITEETSGTVINRFQVREADMGKKIWLLYEAAADDKDILITIDDQSGSTSTVVYAAVAAGRR